MSLYNLLNGENKNAGLLLKVLDIDQPSRKYQSGRFRDIWIDEDRIVLFTRNGGGNREEYQPLIDELSQHPNYLKDYDDDFDSTYAYIEFSIPEKFKEAIEAISVGEEKPKTLKEKFDRSIEDMEKMSKEELEKDVRFAPIVKIMDKILKQDD